jgi:hypothetical protein
MIPSNNTMQIKPLNSLQSMDEQLYNIASCAKQQPMKVYGMMLRKKGREGLWPFSDSLNVNIINILCGLHLLINVRLTMYLVFPQLRFFIYYQFINTVLQKQ